MAKVMFHLFLTKVMFFLFLTKEKGSYIVLKMYSGKVFILFSTTRCTCPHFVIGKGLHYFPLERVWLWKMEKVTYFVIGKIWIRVSFVIGKIWIILLQKEGSF